MLTAVLVLTAINLFFGFCLVGLCSTNNKLIESLLESIEEDK